MKVWDFYLDISIPVNPIHFKLGRCTTEDPRKCSDKFKVDRINGGRFRKLLGVLNGPLAACIWSKSHPCCWVTSSKLCAWCHIMIMISHEFKPGRSHLYSKHFQFTKTGGETNKFAIVQVTKLQRQTDKVLSCFQAFCLAELNISLL